MLRYIGEIAGPTILAAGSSISPTGGHGDVLDRPDQVLELFASSGLCDGVGECRRAVRRQFRQGADLIKIHATGGGNERTGGKHHAPSFMMDELTTIIETAHSLDLKATAHAHATAGINAALRAGVDSIEHGSFLDDESIRLFNSTGAYLVPTLDVQDMIAERMDSVPGRRWERMQQFQEEHPAKFRMAYQAGVKIAMGSDAGVVPHGTNAREVEWLVKMGVSTAAALRIATLGSADHLGLAVALPSDINVPGWSGIEEFRSLPQTLSEAGYHTGLVGKYHLGMPQTPQLGFKYWVTFPSGHTTTFYDQTVIYTSDQGASYGHHGLFGNTSWSFPFTAHNVNMQIPLIVRHPGRIPSGMETDRVIRTPEWKYMKRLDDDEPNTLYHLGNDPEERVNLVDHPAYTDVANELDRRLTAFFDRYGDKAYDLWKGGTAKGILLEKYYGRNDIFTSRFPDWKEPSLEKAKHVFTDTR